MTPHYTAPKPTSEERFWAKVDRSGDCWVWIAGTTEWGYGRFRMDGRLYLAHRVAYMFLVGPVPDGMGVLHRCDNPPCCNPAHLFLGTDADNSHDCIEKGRNARGERGGKAKLSELDVQDLRQLYASGMSFQRLAPLYGVSVRTVRAVVNRETWKHVP